MNTYSKILRNDYKIIALIVICLLISSCSTTPTDYASTKPEFDMATFFNGKLKAYGIIQNRSGKVIRRFHADLLGTWQGNQGRLEEDFFYDDDQTQRRVWSLTKEKDNQYIGTASDVIGSAYGESRGFAFNWHYTLAIDSKGKVWNIKLDDWLYQINDSRLINKTVMTKWGFKVGEVTLIIEKVDE